VSAVKIAVLVIFVDAVVLAAIAVVAVVVTHDLTTECVRYAIVAGGERECVIYK